MSAWWEDAQFAGLQASRNGQTLVADSVHFPLFETNLIRVF
ncbi:IncF plasmid conjugative transfer protein TraD (plasmid) [Yersinia enterocolitica subsp. palearctica Y11]|uniref:IncF plasmid conjugative transfer protein TraD n=1 Tax=Yersinia enterocolitica subsp. palearctica serotype O:3 (strain DSM 13030 / CIP 106945 / Y11) TaxID=930944 RepID=A0A0H3P161_YERE1|nr:IncF plasmid conjugative transfer protein TraD [Yersinia enterocolitica subsp. palearctica YE-P1]EOR65629.1 IncF plasmid conjugative transfer protein TraD [Yersinia enterocolitica subsp. palearctica YE-149]CBY78129.1 IncF plasmid conjugative transfer protein TraD [Yersinia enterocolitica subsp. palearctica Y11]